jgi:glycosyltransferase involved in cell wall biosynthesis
MYDAINKGIKMATGDVVGILNADDVLADDETLAHIVSAFNTDSYPLGTRSARRVRFPKGREPPQGAVTTPDSSRIDAVYADIRFVREGESVAALREAKTVRYCSAKRWRPWMFRFAAMVPHPSFYVRRECFARLGGYSLDYRICADFELELRYLYLAKLRAAYLPECVVVMRMGGMSTAGWRSNIVINREDLRALRANGVWSCLPLIYLKYLFKIWGFVFRKR